MVAGLGGGILLLVFHDAMVNLLDRLYYYLWVFLFAFSLLAGALLVINKTKQTVALRIFLIATYVVQILSIPILWGFLHNVAPIWAVIVIIAAFVLFMSLPRYLAVRVVRNIT